MPWWPAAAEAFISSYGQLIVVVEFGGSDRTCRSRSTRWAAILAVLSRSWTTLPIARSGIQGVRAFPLVWANRQELKNAPASNPRGRLLGFVLD